MFISLSFFNVLYDLEEDFAAQGIEGIDKGMINLFILLYADDILIFSIVLKGCRTIVV